MLQVGKLRLMYLAIHQTVPEPLQCARRVLAGAGDPVASYITRYYQCIVSAGKETGRCWNGEGLAHMLWLIWGSGELLLMLKPLLNCWFFTNWKATRGWA